MQVVKEPVIEFTIGPEDDCLIIRVTRTEAERLLAAASADKMVAGYFEPYSWAFRDDVHSDAKFLEALRRIRSRSGDSELCAFVDSAVGEVLSNGVHDAGAPDRWREKARALLSAAVRKGRR